MVDDVDQERGRAVATETFRMPVLLLSITLMPVVVTLFFSMPYMGAARQRRPGPPQ